MPFTYDIKNDIRYKQGRDEGLEKSIESLLLKTSFTVKQVADILNVSLDLVKKIAKELKK